MAVYGRSGPARAGARQKLTAAAKGRPPPLVGRMDAAIRAAGLLDGCRALVVGVSGGADSVALLRLLCSSREAAGCRLIVAHLHHGLRGRAADRDQAFVRRLAAELRLDVVSRRCDVRSLARRSRLSIEAAARTARLEFFRDVVHNHGADRVALAHTADDQAETLLLRLLRGAGAEGLAAMRPDTRIGGLRIVRPLLGIHRREIEAWLRAHGAHWREDASNADPRYARNRIRSRILPALEREFGAATRAALCRCANIFAAEDDYLAEQAARAARTRLRGGTLRTAGWSRVPLALQRRILRLWLRSRGMPEHRITWARVEQCRRELCLPPKPPPPGTEPRRWPATPVAVPGRTSPAGAPWVLTTAWTQGWRAGAERGVGTLPSAAWIDGRKAEGAALTIRPWRAGDRYRPLGAPGRAKIGNIFTNTKTPLDARAGWPVVVCGASIVWLPGHRIADDWRVPSRRARSLRLVLAPRPRH